MKDKQFLMIPGPTPVPESVLNTLAKHPIGHRSKDFSKIFRSVTEKLQWLAQTKNDVFIYTASGTGAMEGAIANTVSPGDKVLTFDLGKFSQRWGKIAAKYGADVEMIKFDHGQPICPKTVEERLAADTNKEIKVVALTHSETATGVASDIKKLAEVIKAHGALIVVDAVTSLGCMELKIDEWGLDVVVSGSQKGFMVPPGLSFIYVSEKAYEYKAKCTSPSFYFDWNAAKKSLAQDTTPYTPNINLIIALETAMNMMVEEGLENIWARHLRLRDALRAAARGLDLKLLADDANASCAITSVFPPEGISVPDIRSTLTKDWNIIVANGQDELTDKIFRMGHLGFVSDRDLGTAIVALEGVLTKLGYNFKAGSGVAAFHEFMKSQGKEVVLS